jgi:hypothetical protein
VDTAWPNFTKIGPIATGEPVAWCQVDQWLEAAQQMDARDQITEAVPDQRAVDGEHP